MRVPQISDRIKEAPAVALRGFLAGVGQLLLITDKLRNKTGAGEEVPQARTPDASETVPESAQAAAAPPEAAASPEAPAAEAPAAAAPAPAAAKAPTARAGRKRRDLDKTGNVRVLPGEGAEASEPAAAEATAEAAEAAAPPAAEAPAAAEASEAAAALPLANYDELSVASLRARLRNLTVAQVTELVEYEKGHANRAEVVTMFERRIAKLESGG